MKLFLTETVQLSLAQTPVNELERIYIQYIPCPPEAVLLNVSAGKQFLFRWEDVAILHFLPEGKKNKYYHTLVSRDDVLNGRATPADVASYLATLIL